MRRCRSIAWLISTQTPKDSLPEFEVQAPVAFFTLNSYALDLEFVSAWRWLSPPSPNSPIVPDSIVPFLQPLDEQTIISMQTLGAPINTDSLGILPLSTSVPASGTGDIIPLYSVAGSPSDEIQVLEFILSATPPDNASPAIASSDPIFVILSPDGVGFVERLHFASLYLEEYLAVNGLPVPEPTGVASLIFGLAIFVSNNRRLVT